MDLGFSPLLAPRGCVKNSMAGGSAATFNRGDRQLFDMDSGSLAEGAREQQTIYRPQDFVQTTRTIHNLRDRVQKGRRRLVTERVELQRLRSDMEVLEDGLFSAFERLMAQIDTQLSDQFAEAKELRKEIRSRERAYNAAEEKLYSDEYELEAKEDELYQNLDPDSETQLSSSDASLPPEKSYTANDDRLSRNANPLYDYERAIGLADLLHEEIMDLIHDRQEILEEQQQCDPGEEMDQDSLEFLSTYEDTFTTMVKKLDTLEDEILRLQNDAIDDGLLHPSDIYSRTRPWAVFFEQTPIPPSDNQSAFSSVMEVPAKVSNFEEIQTGSHPRFPLPPALPLGVEVCRWITRLQNAHRPSSMSDGQVPDPLDRNWVQVKASSESGHSRNTPRPLGRKSHSDGPAVAGCRSYTVPSVPRQVQSDGRFNSGGPNMSHTAPLKSSVDVRKSHSV